MGRASSRQPPGGSRPAPQPAAHRGGLAVVEHTLKLLGDGHSGPEARPVKLALGLQVWLVVVSRWQCGEAVQAAGGWATMHAPPPLRTTQPAEAAQRACPTTPQRAGATPGLPASQPRRPCLSCTQLQQPPYPTLPLTELSPNRSVSRSHCRVAGQGRAGRQQSMLGSRMLVSSEASAALLSQSCRSLCCCCSWLRLPLLWGVKSGGASKGLGGGSTAPRWQDRSAVQWQHVNCQPEHDRVQRSRQPTFSCHSLLQT